MALIKSKIYPEYYTYVGDANKSTIIFQVTRFPGLDSVASTIITTAVEYEINRNNARLLEVAVYSDNTWWGIVPTYTITTEFKWYQPGVALGEAALEPLTLIAIIAAAIAAIIISIAAIVIFSKYFNIVEKHGWPPWYESMFGKIALVLIAGAGAYAIIKLVPYIYEKIYKEKKT